MDYMEGGIPSAAALWSKTASRAFLQSTLDLEVGHTATTHVQAGVQISLPWIHWG